MKTYKICPADVTKRCEFILKKFHPDLEKVGVKIDLLFVAHDGKGPALTHGGYERAALIDHEIYHLMPAKDKNQRFKCDDQGRPILKLRKHDHQFGWFDEIARRHGENSGEVRQARDLVAKFGQVYFDFMKAGKLAVA